MREGESVTHIGAGSGYYTAILAALTTTAGEVFAYEIDQGMAQRATSNLAHLPYVTVVARSRAEGSIRFLASVLGELVVLRSGQGGSIETGSVGGDTLVVSFMMSPAWSKNAIMADQRQ